MQNFVVFHLTSCSSEKNLSSEKKFRQFCQSCILNVRELFEEFHSQKRFFFSNLVCIFSQNFSNFGETFQKNRQHAFYLSSGTLLEKQYGRNVLNCRWSLLGMLSKLQFTCSQEHFEKGYFFRIFQNCFRTLSVNRPDLWRKVSAAFPNMHSTCPKDFYVFFVNGSHVLFNFGLKRKTY